MLQKCQIHLSYIPSGMPLFFNGIICLSVRERREKGEERGMPLSLLTNASVIGNVCALQCGDWE